MATWSLVEGHGIGAAFLHRTAAVALDARDIGVLFRKHGPLVYGRARRLLGTHEDAEEATQEVFVRVLTGAETLPPESERVPWLCRITTNLCLNRLRDRRRRGELFDAQVKPATSDHDARGPDLPVEVRALLARADEREAAAAVYVFVDGMSHDEAAELLGVSRRTVGNLIERFTSWARAQSPASREGTS